MSSSSEMLSCNTKCSCKNSSSKKLIKWKKCGKKLYKIHINPENEEYSFEDKENKKR